MGDAFDAVNRLRRECLDHLLITGPRHLDLHVFMDEAAEPGHRRSATSCCMSRGPSPDLHTGKELIGVDMQDGSAGTHLQLALWLAAYRAQP